MRVAAFDPASSHEVKLTASDGAPDDDFGRSVAVRGDTAMIGAIKDDDNGTDSGSVYFFQFQQTGGSWTERAAPIDRIRPRGIDGRSDAQYSARHFEEALIAHERMGARPFLALTRAGYAALLLARGDGEKARILLDEALPTARECGMRRLVERVERLRGGGAEAAAAGSAVFRREGEHWTLALSGASCRLKDVLGLSYLAHLVRHPGREIPARELLLLGGPRQGPVSAERARLAVTKRIKAALAKIREHHPDLGRHLDATVKTGNLCAYLPGPDDRVSWSF